MTDPGSDACTRCGLAEATCYAVLTPGFARQLGVDPAAFKEQGLCDRCWEELFGDTEGYEDWIERRARVGENEMEQARAMIEREGWG